MKTSLLIYDIPQVTEFPNPSGALRRRAIRINLSCWVVEQGREPWPLLESMTANQVRWHLFEFDEAATAKVLQQAAWQMRAELEDNAKREAKALKRIDDALATAEAEHTAGTIGWDKLDAARRKHATERRACLKRSETLVKDLEYAAAQFKVPVASVPFAATRTRVAGIRALNGARASLYKEMADQAPASLQDAAQAGDIPGEVLADAVEEAGGDVATARAAFASTHPQAPTPKAAPAPAPVKTAPGREVNTRSMIYNAKAKMLIAEATTLGLVSFPQELAVTSHRTGQVVGFRRQAENYEGDDVASYDYEGPEGLTLRILND